MKTNYVWMLEEKNNKWRPVAMFFTRKEARIGQDWERQYNPLPLRIVKYIPIGGAQ